MSIDDRIAQVFETSPVYPINDESKLILMSDCHRGDNSWSDDFANNQLLYFYALQNYLENGFTYIEVGDGDELWENRDYADIMDAHSHIFWLLNELYIAKRLSILWGNHDIERRNKTMVARANEKFYKSLVAQRGSRAWKPLFSEMRFLEGLRLLYAVTSQTIFLIHGHQFDPFNDHYWQIGRFFNRNFWKHMQLLGFKDPTRPATNAAKTDKVDGRILDWLSRWNNVNQQPLLLVAGHTHHPRFPEGFAPPYFNTGSCVHPRCITGIEIQNGEITLIKWWMTVKEIEDGEGFLSIARDVIGGPVNLRRFSGK